MTNLDFTQLNPTPDDPFPMTLDTRQMAIVDGTLYAARQFDAYLFRLNDTTHVFDDFASLAAFGDGVFIMGLAARDGFLWASVFYYGGSSPAQLGLFQIAPDGTITQKAVFGSAFSLGLAVDPLEDALYFVTSTPDAAAYPAVQYGIIRYDIPTDTYSIFTEGLTYNSGPGPLYGGWGSGQPTEADIAFTESGKIVICGFGGYTPELGTSQYMLPFVARFDRDGTLIERCWLEPPPIDSDTLFAVPNTITCLGEDAYITWQAMSGTGLPT